MIIPFGRYKRSDTGDPNVPDSYLMWLSDPEAANRVKGKPSTAPFKMPTALKAAASEELRKRGYRRIRPTPFAAMTWTKITEAEK